MNKNILYMLITLFLYNLVLTNSLYASELLYRYKVDGILLGEKIIIPNMPPIINSENLYNGSNGVEYNYFLNGSDSDGDNLTWSWSGEIPQGLILNTETGLISGTPKLEGVYNINISLSDGVNKPVYLSSSIEILGCTNGEIGSVCGNGTVYIGDVNNKRIYVYNNWNNYSYIASRRPFEQITPVCQDLGGFVPNIAELRKIYENLDVANIKMKFSRSWTSEHVLTKPHPESYVYSVSYNNILSEDYIYGVQNYFYCISY